MYENVSFMKMMMTKKGRKERRRQQREKDSPLNLISVAAGLFPLSTPLNPSRWVCVCVCVCVHVHVHVRACV